MHLKQAPFYSVRRLIERTRHTMRTQVRSEEYFVQVPGAFFEKSELQFLLSNLNFSFSETCTASLHTASHCDTPRLCISLQCVRGHRAHATRSSRGKLADRFVQVAAVSLEKPKLRVVFRKLNLKFFDSRLSNLHTATHFHAHRVCKAVRRVRADRTHPAIIKQLISAEYFVHMAGVIF